MPLDNPSVNLDDSGSGPEGAFTELDISTLSPPAPWLDELAALYDHVSRRSATLLGYPESQVFTRHPLVDQFGRLAMNNLGEPAETDGPMRYATNSAAFERWVLDWFAWLYDLPLGESWGYLTGSGSEGNLWGLLLGRESCGGVSASPVLYHSDAAHYSVHKAALVLGIEERVVPHLRSGEMDYGSLAEAMRTNKGRPAVILATAGTTITEAIDDVQQIAAVCELAGVPQSYIHLDAALCGLTLPFHPDPTAPKISFADTPIGSVSVSIHKFLGARFPVGVALARRQHVDAIRKSVEYVASGNGTLFGSRNGQAPLDVRHSLETAGPHLPRLVSDCVANAKYLEAALVAKGIPAWRNPYGITVVFPTPRGEVVEKWSLATQGDCAHVITVPSATRAKLDALIADLVREVPRPSVRATALTARMVVGAGAG